MYRYSSFFALNILIKTTRFDLPNVTLDYNHALKKLCVILIYLLPISALAEFAHPKIDSVLIEKSQRKMYLLSGGITYREFDVSLGDNPVGHKKQRGDKRTPEGKYTINYRNPNSRYHLSLHITYPNKGDKDRANALGVNPGGDIFIHGLPNGLESEQAAFQYRDWTAGCIAVTNSEIKEIWQLVKNGTAIEIRP